MSHREAKTEENTTELTAITKITTKNLDTSYPQTPREVIKLYNDILKCYYNENCTEDEIRALGSQAATPDFFEFEAQEGYLLLCSDGLSNMISDDELKELLLDHDQIANKTNQMIARANEYGGKDNISLVIVDLKR